MQISVMILGIYGILFFMSRKMKLEQRYRKWEIPFYKLTMFLKKKSRRKAKENIRKQQVQSLWITHRITWEEYETRKIAVTLMILFGTLCISVLVSIFEKKEGEIISFLKRPLYGEAGRTEELEVWIEEKQKYKVPVSIQARKYSAQEAREKVETALAELDEMIKGDNTTLNEVRSDLMLPASMQEGAVQVEWTTIPYGIVSQTGEILKETKEEGEVIKLEAKIRCQEEEANYSAFARVFLMDRTEEEAMIFKIKNAVKEQDEKEREKEKITLPEKLDGKEIRWQKSHIPAAVIVLISGVVSACYFWSQRDQKLEKTAKKRQEQLKSDYAVLIFKMRMLLGAGMTIRAAFTKIAAEYEEHGKKEICYVYEEMVHACKEMESGVAEETAYEQFGQRCGQPRYLKLGRLLAQHLKKGNEGLEEILGQEMQQAQEERIELAKKKGEETGVKLLIPMGMMLIVVLAVLVIPAFLNL